MAKFCGNCGNRLNGGEPFCPQCGYRIKENAVQPTAAAGAPQYAPAPAPQPAAQTPAYPPAAPQPAPAPVPAPQPIPAPVPVPQPQPIQPQGAPPPAAPPQAAPAKQIPSYADFSRSAGQTNQKQNQPAKKRGCGSCFLNVMLSLLIAVQLAIAAYWHPGFMVSGPKPENSDSRRIAAGNKPTAQPSKTDRNLSYPGSVSRIKARYSEDTIKYAPKSEAAVSPKNSQAECGGVKAEFRSWNLQGDDAFIVRALPELADKEAGYTVKGYDFSMASGQNEFATDVALTIPRTAKGENDGFCVAFNEAAGQWERVYSEISADGKSYTIYTDHFCPKGEALPTNELTKSIANGVTGKDLENKQLRDYFGIFYYNQSDLSHQKNDSGQWERPGCTQMTVPVFADYACLWYFFTEKYAYSLDDIAKAI
ncbi:zinc ribbon domain-containing protein [bacterium]|nr:zinc ribbon domain-containing protein [bacterium]